MLCIRKNLVKIWEYSLRPRFKSFNFESTQEFGKVYVLIKVLLLKIKWYHILNLIWKSWMRYSSSSDFRNLCMNWEKCFPLGKMGYCTHLKFCAYCRISDLRKGPANTFTPSPPNIKDYLCCKNIFSIKQALMCNYWILLFEEKKCFFAGISSFLLLWNPQISKFVMPS